jgi:hemoglobin
VSLYDEIGGQAGVDALVSDFYGRVFGDPVLRPFFERADQHKLITMQQQFFAVALGGPVEYAGSSLREAHGGLGITPRHLSLFTEHLLETLLDRGVGRDEADQVVSHIALYADDVIGEGVGEDG